MCDLGDSADRDFFLQQHSRFSRRVRLGDRGAEPGLGRGVRRGFCVGLCFCSRRLGNIAKVDTGSHRDYRGVAVV